MEASATAPVLAPRGALDLASSRGLATELGELAGTPGDAVLDLSAVDFMDSVGLGVVLKGVNRYSRQGKTLILVVPPEGNVSRLLHFAGARSRVTVAETRDEALRIAAAAR